MVTTQTAVALQHYPEPMGVHGKNPYGENMYRIVRASSRVAVMGTEIRPLYRHLGEKWILERWMSAEEFTRDMTLDRWNRELAHLLGPYPSRGEYEMAHVFETAVSDHNLVKLIAWIEEGHKRHYAEHYIANRNAYEQEEADIDKLTAAQMANSLPAFGSAAFAGAHGIRGTKTKEIRIAANDTPLPLGNNKFVTGVNH